MQSACPMITNSTTRQFFKSAEACVVVNSNFRNYAGPHELRVELLKKRIVRVRGTTLGTVLFWFMTMSVWPPEMTIAEDVRHNPEIERRIVFEGFDSGEEAGIELYLVEFHGYMTHSILQGRPGFLELLFRSRASDSQLHDDLAKMLDYIGVASRLEAQDDTIRISRPDTAQALLQEALQGKKREKPINLQISSARGPTPVYRIGEDLELLIELDDDAWVYCFYLQANGSLVMLLPNRYRKLTRLDGGQTHAIAGDDFPFSLMLTEPVGEEMLHCFASGQHLDAELPVDLRDLEGAVLEAPLSYRFLDAFRAIPGVSITEATLSVTVTN